MNASADLTLRRTDGMHSSRSETTEWQQLQKNNTKSVSCLQNSNICDFTDIKAGFS